MLRHLVKKNARYIRYQIHSPATISEVSYEERQCGIRFPRSLSSLFIRIAGRMEFSWALASSPSILQCQNFILGCISWDLHSTQRLIDEKNQLESGTVFEDMWVDKIPLVSVGDGSFIAASSDFEGPNSVFYLRPGERDVASVLIGRSIERFLLEWFDAAGVTTEAILQLIDDSQYGISASSARGAAWRTWLSEE